MRISVFERPQNVELGECTKDQEKKIDYKAVEKLILMTKTELGGR